MTEAILSALWVGTALFFTVREINAKNNRESHEYWLSELRECLHSIEDEFARLCLDIAYDSSYGINITNLKNQYKEEVYNKVVARKGKYFVKTLPDYIIKEYERNISEITDIYLNIYYKQRT